MTARAILLIGTLALAGCTVWPVNQDPAGMNYRRDLNAVILALQSYRHDHGNFPASLAELSPAYIGAIPGVPNLAYHASDGTLEYRYIPSWPQLRPVWCSSVGNTTEWRCAEHII
jgi:hypothetical protein